MDMIKIIKGIKGLNAAGLFRNYFEARHHQYVIKRQWSLPHKDGLEIDVYDDDRAIYLLNLDEDESILSSIRMLPTTGPHLLTEVFSHLCQKPIPAGVSVFEMTRYFVSPHVQKSKRLLESSGEVLIAMVEWAVLTGVTNIISVIDEYFLPQMLEAGWRPTLLGHPLPYGGGPDYPGGGIAIAVNIPVSEDCLSITRATHEARRSVWPTAFQRVTTKSAGSWH